MDHIDHTGVTAREECERLLKPVDEAITHLEGMQSILEKHTPSVNSIGTIYMLGAELVSYLKTIKPSNTTRINEAIENVHSAMVLAFESLLER